ncbi:GFA family protein [Thaumasiovibrio subtropicus]|uniref:GFA family protein n=1 Tax=Thaumasiovibrio subtropicus TaxID=1891207 RepID=UPI000B3508D8|nr:GFA family protein [Thaumasiovibrio subtropicus]
MNNTIELKGQCMCGKVKVHARQANPHYTVCHCSMCRTWGGGPYFAIQCGTNITFDGEEHIVEYDSSDWGKRGFCQSCGTHLYYFFKQTASYNVPLGLMEENDALVMSMQYFSDRRPDHYCFTNQTSTLTSEEIFAYFADKS